MESTKGASVRGGRWSGRGAVREAKSDELPPLLAVMGMTAPGAPSVGVGVVSLGGSSAGASLRRGSTLTFPHMSEPSGSGGGGATTADYETEGDVGGRVTMIVMAPGERARQLLQEEDRKRRARDAETRLKRLEKERDAAERRHRARPPVAADVSLGIASISLGGGGGSGAMRMQAASARYGCLRTVYGANKRTRWHGVHTHCTGIPHTPRYQTKGLTRRCG